MPTIHLIAAVASNGVIGAAQGMPWHIPEDLGHFKQLTMGHTVIMDCLTGKILCCPKP